jgi:rubrerythrin
MHKMTEADLWAAFAGESQAHVKYQAFAGKAREEGFPKLARLFEAISYAELVHAHNHLRALAGLGTSPDNLKTALDGENYEVEEMYPAFNAVATLQNESAAMRSIHYAEEAEKIHAGLYSRARQDVENGTDTPWQKIYICPVCGFTSVDEVPDKCPVCATPRDKFKLFE